MERKGSSDIDLELLSSDHHFNASDSYITLGGEDDLSCSGEREASKLVAAEIYSLTKLLKEPLPIHWAESVEKEGYLYIQSKFGRGWKKRWFVWKRDGEAGGFALYYYKDKNQAEGYKKPLLKFSKPKADPRAMGVVHMTFAHKEPFTTREKEELALALEKHDIPQNGSFIRLASPNRLFSLSGDEELDAWYEIWKEYLQNSMEDDHYVYKLDAAQRLESLLRQQYSVWLEKASSLARTLEANGFFGDKFTYQKRDKSGSLELASEKSPGVWKKTRFILIGRYLYYYPHHKGPTAKRVVVLQYSSVEGGEQQDDGTYVFYLVTPLITYTLKAPHKVAAEEWMNAIEKAKLGRKRMKKSGDGDDDQLLVSSSAQPEDDEAEEAINPHSAGGAFLTYMLPNSQKEKVFKIKKDSIKIGRSSSNDLVIDDTRISREHARIDTLNERLVFVDLGSKRGSKVNHHICNGRKYLKNGDLIKVGRTRMRVFAGKPGKH